MEKNTIMKKLSVKGKIIVSCLAVFVAVALPQLFHLVGAVSGLGTKLGEVFLPMHISVLMAGLIAGPIAGLVAGALSPVLSFALTGMPGAVMLPFMVIELAVYGLTAGLLYKTKLPCVVKLLIAQISGRAVRAVAILIAVYCFDSVVKVSSIWTSISVGMLGLILQWTLIPLIMYRLKGITDESNAE